MNNDNELTAPLLDDAIEVTVELRQAIERIFVDVRAYNLNPNRTEEDSKWLKDVVDNFNFDQKYQAVRVKCSTSTELLDQYIKHRIVPQIKVAPHSSTKLHGIEFSTHYLDFLDFYNANKSVFPNYHEFQQVLSSFLHNIQVEILRNSNHNSFFPYYPYSPGPIVWDGDTFSRKENRNQFSEYYISLEWCSRLDVSSVTGKSKLNDIFTTILTTYFPGFQYNHFPRHIWNNIFAYIANGHTLRTTMDYLLRLAWRQVHKQPGMPLNAKVDNNYEHTINRHIAWCENENKRNCMLFHFECHSSVNCPFYRESPLKKRNNKAY